jgi:hypothetical protein
MSFFDIFSLIYRIIVFIHGVISSILVCSLYRKHIHHPVPSVSLSTNVSRKLEEWSYLEPELEFLKSLWGLGTEEEEGYRTGPLQAT